MQYGTESPDFCGKYCCSCRVVYLQDEDVLHLAGNELKLSSMASLPASINRHVTNLSMKLEAITKGKYRFFMEKEIFEQAESLQQTLTGRVLRHKQIFALSSLSSSKLLLDYLMACLLFTHC